MTSTQYRVVYDTLEGLVYRFDTGDIQIPLASLNSLTALTGDLTATGPNSAVATLATVNTNVGSFTNASITVNGKGLVTAVSSGTAMSVVDSTTYSSGQAVITPLVAGLLTTSTIWSVTQTVKGGSNLPLLGYANLVNGQISLTYVGDPSTGAVVRVVFHN